ncbi:MAG: symmetrical bis(5'-nucleosyl)-tetraphosphatase [Burkholderiaceae bacterium]
MTGPIAIGDLQGCQACLERLLDRLVERFGQSAAEAPLWLTGDLVNRGPQSLAALRWAYRHRDRIVTVLGNHDLHLLAVSQGIRKPSRGDTLDEILAAPDRDLLLDWLRRQPLAWHQHGWLMVHAGLLPGWSAEQAVALSDEVSAMLSSDGWIDFLRHMYGNGPPAWRDDLGGHDRLRVIVNAMTRLRFCTADGVMDFRSKGGADSAGKGLVPWFDVPGRASRGTPIVFGHWSTLGLVQRDDLLAIDTGCVWGGQLTAVRLADRACVQWDCPQAAAPGGE